MKLRRLWGSAWIGVVVVWQVQQAGVAPGVELAQQQAAFVLGRAVSSGAACGRALRS